MQSRLRISSLHQRVYHTDQPLQSPTHHSTSPPPSASDSLPPFALPSPSSKSKFRHQEPSPALWLVLYFTLNLTLTLYNKTVLIHFPFPYTLTALHAFCGFIGSSILLRTKNATNGFRIGGLRPSFLPKLDKRETLVLFLFSILYTVNIVVSNASLRLVTVPFHQVVRASSPFFTILLSYIILHTRTNRTKLVSLIPVVVGVGFATYGDYYFTPAGFLLTLLGTILAALKSVITNLLQSSSPSSFPHPSYPISFISSPILYLRTLPKLTFTPLHLLSLLSPLAFIQSLLLAYLSGELGRVQTHFYTSVVGTARIWLLLNGILAFLLNVVSFNANKKVGALGMSVAGNVKQVLTILCAVALFNLNITPMNGIGIALTLFGGMWYAQVELRERSLKL
ncbi:triose-phosphate transporter family-domain-containing protein [Crucibulum laeve]|uniref:Triose-phosphate transporter family-domain-containing protein n=1 Tax=Crucibulum laeve TaxID=68775 RepID=A0A5C3LSP5_9AGAR|nr:triose-phosphate transporter family-domain-containing protein [Crucibulum laeve]